MKEFAAATIDKVAEMKAQAEKANLHLCVDVDLATEGTSIGIYELDERDKYKIKTPSLFFRHGSYLDRDGVKAFAKNLAEAAEYIAGYTEKKEATLMERKEELTRQLQAVNKSLRKARKAANK
jgi:hypothetical protein